jgi:NADH:ubiquinone oxidoreductase subunit H
MLMAMYSTFLKEKLLQDRVGPNRAGKGGFYNLLQMV